MVAEKEIRKVLSQVVDPEIPVLTIEEMGILDDVKIIDNRINIFILPTYNGCPAMDLIKMEINRAMYDAGFRNFNIHLKQSPPWTTERMATGALAKMEAYGIAPPQNQVDINALINEYYQVQCPKCKSEDTSLLSSFGATACKAMFKCNQCLEPFEYFKCFKAGKDGI